MFDVMESSFLFKDCQHQQVEDLQHPQTEKIDQLRGQLPPHLLSGQNLAGENQQLQQCLL